MQKGTKVKYDGQDWTVRESKEIQKLSGDSEHWLKLSQNEPPTRIAQVWSKEVSND